MKIEIRKRVYIGMKKVVEADSLEEAILQAETMTSADYEEYSRDANYSVEPV